MANFIGAYCDYAAERTNAPIAFHEFSALAILCAALGKRVWIEADWGRVYPAPWICLVGGSKVHKSYAASLAVQLLQEAQPDVTLPGSWSVEALFERLAKQPHGLMEWGEVAHAFATLSKEYNAGSVGLMIELWDSRPTVSRETLKAGVLRIHRPALTILAAGKPVWFQEEFRPQQVGGLGGGFIGRWMYVLEEHNRGYRSSFASRRNGRRDHLGVVRQSLVEHLQQLEQIEGEVDISDEALQVYDRWAEGLEQISDAEDPAEFSKRAEANVLKLSLALQASHDPTGFTSVSAPAIQQAIALWRRTYDSGQRLVAMMRERKLGRDEEDLDKLIGALAELGADQKPTTRSEAMRKSRLMVVRFDQCMATLKEMGRVEEHQERRNERGPKTRFYTLRGDSHV